MRDSDIVNYLNSIKGVDIITLPPAYSVADRERREAIYKKLAALEREYREAAQPLIDEMAKIDAAYPTRFCPVPHKRKGPSTR